jgi:DNA polymerase-3 subunit delta'
MVGNERIVDSLHRDVAAGRLPHALLLSGPEGVGKTRLALELAKALNCTGESAPCQRCPHCRQIESGSHPDVWLIQRADTRDSILIQQVRELRTSASLRAFQGKRKVYIISGAEALSAPAADALLKTLEEPQSQVTIVLTASDLDALPPTVLSRCRSLILQSVDPRLIEQTLIERGQLPETAHRLARLAHGSVGWALRASADPELVSRYEDLIASLSSLLDLDLGARLELVETLTAKKDRWQARRVLELLVLLARDLIYLHEGMATDLTTDEAQRTLARQADRFGLGQLHAYMRCLRTAMERVEQNVDPRLALEAIVVNLP